MQHRENSESEDDPDYVPSAEVAGSSDDEPDAKKVKICSSPTGAVDEAERKRARDALWANFQSSLSTQQPHGHHVQHRTVKIEKRHRFAGEETIEVEEVPEGSEEAKKWPLWKPPVPVDAEGNMSQLYSPNSASGTEHQHPPESSTPAASSSTPTKKLLEKTPAKRPGPRKPKTKLASLPEPARVKKLTTLDKSAMDWKAHVAATPDPSLKDDLEANRRGGGYLEKVEFLQRVGERKDQTFEANQSTKRRRG